MLTVILYNNQSDDRAVVKTLSETIRMSGSLRGEASLMSPTIMCEIQEIPTSNYAYIPEFKRYYFIKDIQAYRDNMYIISFSIDVLMTYAKDILSTEAIIERQSSPDNYDVYIDDGSFVTENLYETRVYPFSSGFNDNTKIMIITAG